MSSDVTAGFVRPARAGDAVSLARIQVASWRCGFAGIVPQDLLAELTSEEAEQVWRDRWREAITNPPTSRHRVLASLGSYRPAGRQRPVSAALQVYAAMATSAATGAARDITLIAHPDN